jgi:carboxypeptidase family protein
VNSRPSGWIVRAGVILLSCLIPIFASGQTPGPVLSGTVHDPSGKPVAQARVSLKNVATGQTTQSQTDSSGGYDAPGLAPGDYDVSVAAEGFSTTTTRVTVAATGHQTVDLTLRPLLSLEDLGLSLAQAQGNARDQALLDKRSHMLKLHQRYGLIAAIPMIATVATGGSAGGKSSTSSDRNIHAALGLTTAALYSISAYYAIAAPTVPGTQTSGNTRWHKTLAWVHGAGMILTPVLGALAYQQKKDGEKVHGIASAHGAVAIGTVIAYAAAMLTESLK